MRHRRLLIYLAPALMDMVLAQFFFVGAVRLARMGVSASGVAGVLTMWGVIYLVSCPVVGRLLTVANSTRLILTSCLLTALVCVLFAVFPSRTAIYVLIGCMGVLTALFFPPFQIFMKAVDAAQSKPVTHSTGLYTFAWSMGFAMGPFVAGFLMELGKSDSPGAEPFGWKIAYLFSCGVALLAAGLIAWLKHLRHEVAPSEARRAPGDVAPPVDGIDYTRLPDLAWVGWLTAGVGVMVLSLVRGVFPARAVTVLSLSAAVQGTIFFLLSLVQAFTGLVLCRSRLWMYRPLPVVLQGIAGVIGTLCLGYGRTVPVLCVGAMLFGLYAGAFFYYLVFHSLTHPSRSAQYVAINESVVGVGGIIGPLLGGLLADRAGFGPAYLVGALLMAAAILAQAVIHYRCRVAVARLL